METEKSTVPVTAVKVLESAHSIRVDGMSAVHRRICSDRRLVMMLYMAAKNQDWALSIFYHYLNPEWSHQQLAAYLGLKRSTVSCYLTQVEITEEIYDLLPLES